jgi:hypothetical protein
MLGRLLRAGAAATAACSLALSPAWGAGGGDKKGRSSVSAEDRKAAQREFAEGQRAFKLGDFRHAALSFESAYRHAPHHDPLWNAARAWHRAGDLARAANLYAKYLREAPPRTPDRNTAQSALDALSQKLARLEVHANGLDEPSVDGTPLEHDSVYVAPGEHVIEARADKRTVTQRRTVEAGTVVSVAIVPPPPEPPPPPPKPPPPPEPKRKGWPPVVVYVGGAVTALAGGITIWSGVDTRRHKTTFDAAPTQDNLDTGLGKQTRTNVLLGVTAGAAVLTGVAAVWLVDWRSPRSEGAAAVRLDLGPGSATLTGRF